MIWKCKNLEFDLSKRILLMGILNVTPDSFSDGGSFKDPSAAICHGIQMAIDGADIIDVGGESTRPGAEPVSPQEEIRRVIPVIKGLRGKTRAAISVDTRNYEVAYEAMQEGAHIINDVSALQHSPRMAELAVESDAGVVMMHMKGEPGTMQQEAVYDDVVGEIVQSLKGWFKSANEISGLEKERVVFDPGIGFGKTVEQNAEIFQRLRELHKLERPVMLGFSRKSFLRKLGYGEPAKVNPLTLADTQTGPPGFNPARTTAKSRRTENALAAPDIRMLEANAAATTLAILRGIQIIRVHDVAEMARVIKITRALR